MRRRSEGRVGVKVVALLAGERVYVGVDVHKRSYSVGVWSDRRGLLRTWSQPPKGELLLEKLEPYRGQLEELVYEAGPTGYGLVRFLRAAGWKAEVIAPSKQLVPAGPEAKSDRLDCGRLAEHAGKGLLTKIQVPTEAEEADRQVVRVREELVAKRRRVRQQIKSFLLQYGIAEPVGLKSWGRSGVAALRELKLAAELRFSLDLLLAEEAFQSQLVDQATARVAALARSRRHEKAVACLRSTKAVGLVTAMTYRTELVAAERFEAGVEVAKQVGLAPQVVASGETRYAGHLLKTGNRRLRRVLVEAAWRWVARDELAKAQYRRLLANTGDCRKAIVGIARRLAILLWRLETRRERYAPQKWAAARARRTG